MMSVAFASALVAWMVWATVMISTTETEKLNARETL